MLIQSFSGTKIDLHTEDLGILCLTCTIDVFLPTQTSLLSVTGSVEVPSVRCTKDATYNDDALTTMMQHMQEVT